ncbi:hypothetical protein FE257_004867 [Aspergillus nanangensis]|uniref:HET-C domain protein HetC n=1 Tax=Aspergillus nanangensis TaxID=2582783 RepID=A0AAD4CBU9_ASPNN|nr:hypothetical protein FE257_004867 [Aspergillus nanangensis]
MASSISLGWNSLLILALFLVLLPSPAHAFGAGNIASISTVEGKNWRHGDIEDMLKTIAFLKGHKWTSTMLKRVYFGNWLRDYSQAMDVGTLKSLPADTIRVLVWILSFMSFGYATAEFEVTSERLGVYRPEEHIDNPKDYADNEDARKFDSRLRGPIRQIELDIDPQTGMKNYIANERGDWATSAGYIKYSLARSIHYGRLYTSGGRKGNEEDLCEALRCLGQGLHTLEDFAAHTNYCELALREMGFHNVFPHTGVNTQINLHGHKVYPLVTGTFGMVDFFHSVLGEATDHFTQSEVNEMDNALVNAQSNSSTNSGNALISLLGKIPGTKDLIAQAEELKRRSESQSRENQHNGAHTGYAAREVTRAFNDHAEQSRGSRPVTPGQGEQSGPMSSLQNFDSKKTIAQIYPILEFRDKVVRKLSSIIEKIPGLEALVEKITETLTVFIMSLLAPFIRPLINSASQSLHTGSAGVIDASGKHQYEPWTDPHCTDPTHSLLSKDHFSNILNEPAGHVASAILKYVAPRVLHAWQNINVPEQQVLDDCLRVFHHPVLRDMHNEAHRTMYEAVQSWVKSRSDRGAKLDDILSAEGVKAGKNNTGDPHDHSHGHGHSHGAPSAYSQTQSHSASHSSHGAGYGATGADAGGAAGYSHGHGGHGSSHGQSYGSSHGPNSQGSSHQQQSSGSSLPWEQLSSLPIPGFNKLDKLSSTLSSLGLGGGSSREESSSSSHQHQSQHQSQSGGHSGHSQGHSSGDYYGHSQQQSHSHDYEHQSHSHDHNQHHQSHGNNHSSHGYGGQGQGYGGGYGY